MKQQEDKTNEYVGKYLKRGNVYIKIASKTPDRIYQVSENMFELVYDEGEPTEYRELVSIETLKTIGEIVDSY